MLVCTLVNEDLLHIKVIILVFVSDSGHNYHHTVKEFVQLLTKSVPSVPSDLFKIITGSFFKKGFLSLCQAVAPPVMRSHPTTL